MIDKQTKNLNWVQALEKLKAGKYIRLSDWPDDVYLKAQLNTTGQSDVLIHTGGFDEYGDPESRDELFRPSIETMLWANWEVTE